MSWLQFSANTIFDWFIQVFYELLHFERSNKYYKPMERIINWSFLDEIIYEWKQIETSAREWSTIFKWYSLCKKPVKNVKIKIQGAKRYNKIHNRYSVDRASPRSSFYLIFDIRLMSARPSAHPITTIKVAIWLKHEPQDVGAAKSGRSNRKLANEASNT